MICVFTGVFFVFFSHLGSQEARVGSGSKVGTGGGVHTTSNRLPAGMVTSIKF